MPLQLYLIHTKGMNKMEYCKKVIIKKIQQQLETMDNSKLMIRIESFDDAKLYLDLHEYFKKECEKRHVQFVAKITYYAWEKLKEKQSYYAREMQEKNIVDTKNRITYYRNEVVNTRKILLFFGTEYAEDKAGLNELFLINPVSVEADTGENYSSLFEKYNEFLMDKEKKRLNHFYHELFKYVPKNLIHLSDIADQLSPEIASFDELLQILLENMYKDWRMPNLQGYSTGKFKEKGKNGILEKAYQFKMRKKFTTASSIKKYVDKIMRYRKMQGKYFENWPQDTMYSSYDDFAESLSRYIEGKNVKEHREKLCNMDFSIINDVLDLKVDTNNSPKEKTVKLYDSPLIMLEKVVLKVIQNRGEIEFNKISIRVDEIGIAGVHGDEEEEDTKQDIKTIWRNICRYCGGIIEYLNGKGLGKIKNCKVDFVVQRDDKEEVIDIFCPENIGKLCENGILKALSVSNKLSKIKFVAEIKQDTVVTGKTKFEWMFSEFDGWVNTFIELDNEFLAQDESGSFIPFGVISTIQTYVEAQSADDFYDYFSQRNVKYYNLVPIFKQGYGQDYSEYYEQYKELGKRFLTVVTDICEKGFFSILEEGSKLQELLDDYEKLAEKLFVTNADDKLLTAYKLFFNAFLLSDSTACVKKDAEVSHAIVPAYHPATLEKMKEKADFIVSGVNELIRQCLQEKEETEHYKEEELFRQIDFLDELSHINSSVDILKGKEKLLSASKMFDGYGIYSDYHFVPTTFQRTDMHKREGVYDEEYDDSQFKTMTAESRIVCRYIYDYIRTFPTSNGTLDIAVIHYDDFQPIIAALHHITKAEDCEIENLNLYIYMPQEKKGGQNYLAYWMDNFFDEDSEINIQIYLKYYEKEKQLADLMEYKNIDILFLNNVLSEEDISFSELEIERHIGDNKFPMFYKPLPMAVTSMKREVELSQLQFNVSRVHTKLVYKIANKVKSVGKYDPMVVKTVHMDEEKLALIEKLHKIAGWIVCVDMGIDKKILFDYDDTNKSYKIISFSTGEGTFGEYNVTVSARESMVNDLKDRTKRIFQRTFGQWNGQQLEDAAEYCVRKAKELDGSSLLKALNPNDYDINNFLAYVLANEYCKSKTKESDCQIMISLDAYKHWFRGIDQLGNNLLETYPDFLQLSVGEKLIDEDGREKIVIHANLIECKLANENQEHLNKAKGQIINGFAELKRIFNPESTSVKSRFWFSQLYRVLVFSQINRSNTEDEYTTMANDIIGILDGDFKIDWNGEIYTFWKNYDSDIVEEHVLPEIKEIKTKQIVFGQQSIKQMLTGKTDLFVTKFEPIALNEERDDEAAEEIEEMEFLKMHNEETRIEDFYKISQEADREERMVAEVAVTKEEQEKSSLTSVLSIYRAIPEENGIIEKNVVWKEGDNVDASARKVNVESNLNKEVKEHDMVAMEDSKIKTHEPSELQFSSEVNTETSANKGEFGSIKKKTEGMVENKEKKNASNQEKSTGKQEVKVLFGTSKLTGEKLYWNYTNKSMANRHMLITGKSGQGKTYAIQSFLMEFSKAGIPSVIFDYTEGFTSKKLDEIFKNHLQGKIRQNPIKYTKMPINPFERHCVNIHEILDADILTQMSRDEIEKISLEDSVAVATRLAGILSHVYPFGDQQYATIYQACKDGIDKYGNDMNFEMFRQQLMQMENKESKTVLMKLTPFLDTNLFDTKGHMNWSDMLYNDGMVNVIQLTQIPRDMQIIVTEFILWDMWYYSLLNGEEKKPFIVVLDEAQNLDFGEKSPSNKILTEGRKFGWSGWFATQFLKGQLKEDEIGRLQQASQRVYFRPPDNEISSMATSIDQDKSHAIEWMNKLKRLNKGECIVNGDSVFGDAGKKLVPLVTKVSSMGERI